MSTKSEKIRAQKLAFDYKPTMPWHRHLVGPAELESLLDAAEGKNLSLSTAKCNHAWRQSRTTARNNKQITPANY